jgi:hypothetical protein
MSTCVTTIVAANYLAYAQVLAGSLARHGTDPLRVLLVDRHTAEVEAAVRESGLDCIYAQDLGLPDFERIAYKYDVMELSTALKPTFLKRMMAEGFERVVYLDPDIELHAPLQPVWDALDNAEIVLTPHALRPVMDGMRPSDIDFLRAGSFNLGFVALRRGADSVALLDWWESRCLSYGFADLGHGTFVDQKWMDLAPSFFTSVRVLRHPGCNVAYWNLHERTVTHDGTRTLVNGVPLCFFHFSGVHMQAPGVLSKHQTRHVLEPGSELAKLVASYCASLATAGHATFSTIRYTLGTLDDGRPISGTMRRALLASGTDEAAPFRADCSFQRELRAAGITAAVGGAGPAVDTKNFDQAGRQVTTLNSLVRTLARVMGTERVLRLARYGALLTREAHLASVLLRRPLDFVHRLRR